MSTSSVFGSAAAPVSIGGLESGLNTSSIITALTQNENTAITNYQGQITNQNAALTAWQTFNTDLVGLQSIAKSLQDPKAFNTATGTIDQTGVATITANSGAVTGNHTLTVSNLATSQQILSSGVSDATVPLNISGSFLLDGKTINVASTDTLSTIVKNINAAGVPINASVIQASVGNNQISLTSSVTGAINALSASDLNGGTVLEQLGLVPSSSPTTVLRQTITTATGGNGGAGSIAFGNSNQTVATLDGITGTAPSGAVTIGGTSVALNLGSMSISQIASAINSAGISGVQAQIVGIPDASGEVTQSSQKQLQIVSTNGTPLTASSFTDSNNVLSALGITQTAFSNQKSAANDATFTLDGITYSRSSNTVSDALSNVTLNLLSTNNSSTSTPANIAISQNTAAVTTSVQNFVTAYNGINDYINQQNTYTGSTAPGAAADTSTSPLFGNFTLTSIQNQMAGMLSVVSQGQTMGSIGLTVNGTGDLALNTSTFNAALQKNPTAVAGLFGTSGTTTGANLSYSSASSSTKASPAAGYAVNITQAANQAILTAGSAYTAPASAETLTFSSGLFSAANASITLGAGTTLANAIAQINADGDISQYLYASQTTDGKLVLTSKGFGSNQQFNVISNLDSGLGSGIGKSSVGAAGHDVKGTIDGETATGLGTSLIGAPTNKNTAGLQLSYTGTALGQIGSVVVTDGAADQLNALIASVTDPANGAIANQESSINKTITSINTEITSLQTEVSNYSAQLTTEFNNMETELATLKSQQSALTAEVNGGATATSSNSTTGSTGSSTSSGTVSTAA